MVRHKNRYLVIEVIPSSKSNINKTLELSDRAIYGSLFTTVKRIHGQFGAGVISNGFNTKYCNPVTKIAVIKVRHRAHNLVTSSLPFVQSIQDIPISIRILYVGATIRHCFKYILRYQQKAVEKMCLTEITVEAKEESEAKIMDISNLLSLA